MIKKYLSYLGVIILALFSFYYTDRASEIVKSNDPLMKNIINNSNSYYIEAVNAIINDDEIIPGVNGKKVDINKSYQKMKKYNIFDEAIYVFSDIIPEISLLDSYDKYIINGNNYNRNISFIFKVYDFSYVDSLNKILKDKNAVGTFFIDGSLIENNINMISNLSKNGNQIENLGYDGEYSIRKIGWTNNFISSITNKDPKYCYTDYKDNNILDICSKNMMYTIKPKLLISNYPFMTIKNNISNGMIFSFEINTELLKELPSIISYITQKGYNIVTINELLSENLIEEK